MQAPNALTSRGWEIHGWEPGNEGSELSDGSSLVQAWIGILSQDRDRMLFYDLRGAQVTRGQFLDRTVALAHSMRVAGMEAGERIVISCATSIDMVAHYVAALRLGLVVVPINPAFTRPELAHIISSVNPSGAVVDSQERRVWIEVASQEGVARTAFSGPGEDLPVAAERLCYFKPTDVWSDLREDPTDLDTTASSTPALIVFTSGTTGRPKGAIHTHGSLLASARSLKIAWRWDQGDRLVLALPLFHMHGLGVGINGTLLAGGEAVLVGSFDAKLTMETIIQREATLFFGVPTMYQRFIDADVAQGLGRLRLMVSGSAPMAEALQRKIFSLCGQEVLERYGTTESLINISNPYHGARSAGKVGYALPGVRIALVADTSELLVSGPTLFSGYLNDAEATEKAMEGEWFATGDVASVDEEGCISIVGRLKDLIITGGYNVYPREVEEVLRSHYGIADVAVVGFESEKWGEEVVAFVIANERFSREELDEYLEVNLVGYKRPKRIFLVDEFPRNALGKVLSTQLRAMKVSQPG